MNIYSLIDAIELNSFEKVKKCLLFKDQFDINQSVKNDDDSFYFALSVAFSLNAKNNNIEIIKALLEAGADIHKQTDRNDTMLIWAANQVSQNLINICVQYKVNPNTRNDWNQTALILIPFEEKNKKFIQAFIEIFSDSEEQLEEFKKQIKNLPPVHKACIGDIIDSVSQKYKLESMLTPYLHVAKNKVKI